MPTVGRVNGEPFTAVLRLIAATGRREAGAYPRSTPIDGFHNHPGGICPALGILTRRDVNNIAGVIVGIDGDAVNAVQIPFGKWNPIEQRRPSHGSRIQAITSADVGVDVGQAGYPRMKDDTGNGATAPHRNVQPLIIRLFHSACSHRCGAGHPG